MQQNSSQAQPINLPTYYVYDYQGHYGMLGIIYTEVNKDIPGIFITLDGDPEFVNKIEVIE